MKLTLEISVKLFMVLVMAAFMFNMTGCAYGHSLRVGKNKVLILKNDNLLFGILRKAHLCEVGAKGLQNCSENENP